MAVSILRRHSIPKCCTAQLVTPAILLQSGGRFPERLFVAHYGHTVNAKTKQKEPAEAGPFVDFDVIVNQSCFSLSPYFLLISSYVGWITSCTSSLPPAIMSE